MKHRAPSTTAIVRFGALDLVFAIIVPPVFGITLMTSDPKRIVSVFVALGLLRQAAWVWMLRTSLAPLDRWERTPERERDESMLRVAIVTMRRGFDGLMAHYVAGWLAVVGVSTAILVHTEGGLDGDGAPFVLPGLLVGATVACAAGVFAHTQARLFLADIGLPIIAEAERRGVADARTSGTIRTRVAIIAVAIALAPIGWLGAIGLRAATVSAASQASLAARNDAYERSVAGASKGVRERLVRTERFDRWLASASRGGRTDELVDVRASRAYALVRSSTGELVVGSAAIPSAGADGFLFAVLGFFIAVTVWAPICALAFGRDIGDGLGRVTADVGRLIEVGDIRAMQRLPILADDEIGALTRHFNDLVSGLRVLADGAERVAKGDLTRSIEGNGELPEAFRGMLAGLRTLVGRIRQTSIELASAAAEIYSASQEQEAAATQQASGITEVSRTMESLASSAAHIADAVGDVLGDAERTRTTTEQMASRIAELSGHANRIGELLEVIRGVADRSDLLALNGSLEATRAGESGRGFGLVATEMRRLAERVTSTVVDVRVLVGDVRASGSATIMATDQSRKLAENTSDAARRIALVTQQQRTATDQVSASVREVADVLAQAAVATTQTRVSAETLKTQADELEALILRFRTEMPATAA